MKENGARLSTRAKTRWLCTVQVYPCNYFEPVLIIAILRLFQAFLCWLLAFYAFSLCWYFSEKHKFWKIARKTVEFSGCFGRLSSWVLAVCLLKPLHLWCVFTICPIFSSTTKMYLLDDLNVRCKAVAVPTPHCDRDQLWSRAFSAHTVFTFLFTLHLHCRLLVFARTFIH